MDAYEELINKVRTGKLTVDDMSGATITLTNPGTIGTIQSVPRLMPGQGAIIGVGAIGYPAEYQAADPRIIAQLGLSKIIAITSTYDHRIIQGAESGLFLKKVHELLLGEDDFYDRAASTTWAFRTRPSSGGSTTARPTPRTPSTGPSPSRWRSTPSSTSTGCGAT